MKSKEQVLEALENGRGEYLSGKALAERFHVSRNAVWKAIEELRGDGHDIAAVTNRGYRLADNSDVLSAQSIRLYTGNEPFTFEVYGSIASTNAAAKASASSGAPEWHVITASEQSSGHGRYGRSFFSPEGGVYFSTILRPKLPAQDAVLITSAAAVAVAEAVEAVSGKEAKIKWVNDVYLEGKKVCGILTEASMGVESGGLEYAVLGIGINVTQPRSGYPPEISDRAGSVFTDHRAGMSARLIAETLSRFRSYYGALSSRAFLDGYRRRSIVTGRDILIMSDRGGAPATALGIDDECRLIVRYKDGVTATLSSGEISISIDNGGMI